MNTNQNRTTGFASSPFPALNTPDRKRAALSAGQLLDIEMGLFLLSQLLPTAPPDVLPSLLHDNGSSFLDRPTWTPKQHKLLNRGRTLLSHIQQRNAWSMLLDAYTTIPDRLQAYDISADRSRFGEKTVGFFRNRIITLRQMVG
ncbi:pPIWI_RE_Z domain-containing protein [Spirosoma flavum]|uniref:pPIWI-RE three-gene island domain-containing protein n=1 Tax=Spirosoma flavum TaxID=2048557 RepID=A0ABW6AN90_9BACT